MGRVVEVLFADLGHDGVNRVVVEQDRGQDGLLGLDVVGRNAAGDLVGGSIASSPNTVAALSASFTIAELGQWNPTPLPIPHRSRRGLG